MAQAKKLPSGAWRTQASKNINGKRIIKSFTVHPKECKGDSRKAKTLSEMQAREWQLSAEQTEVFGATIKTAMEDYISDRSKVLSPSTITNYKRLIPLFESLWHIYVCDVENSTIQPLINEWSISVKSKTIMNRISFLLSALDYAGCDKKFKLRYPQNNSKVITSPDLEDVKKLIDNASEDFKPVIMLAAFGTLRRGEISAIREKDISRDMNTVTVCADMVLDGDKWIYKPYTKNGLISTIQFPKFVIDAIPKKEDAEAFVFDFNPNMISHRYDKLKHKCGIEYNFHSLRHFAASFRSDLGIPTKYIEEVGRWKNSKVLKQVYDNGLTSSRKKYTKLANDYIEDNFKIV